MIVGINYENTKDRLGGCINDAECMKFLLKSRFGFAEENILMMTDRSHNPDLQPTHRNMLQVGS